MADLWDQITDWWEDDSVWRQQIVLAVAVGLISLTFVALELAAKNKWDPTKGVV